MSERNQIYITNIFIYAWQSLYGRFLGIHFLILFLKAERGELLFISPGNRSHNLPPKFETLLIPYCLVCLFFHAKGLPLLKLEVSFS